MPGMDNPIRLETTGLEQVGPAAWRDGNGDVVVLDHFDLVPNLPAALTDLPALCSRMALLAAQAGGGLVECDAVEVDGVPAVHQLIKLRLPQQQHGLVFVGSLILPKKASSAMVKVQCVEHGTTGLREAAVMAKVGPERFYVHSPYAPAVDMRAVGGLPYHVADHAAYDGMFPEHPLSRARRILAWLRGSARVDRGFAALPPFPGPA
jgi:hypothetical protein